MRRPSRVRSSSAAGDPVVTERATTTVREAVRTADLWLDEVTDLAAPGLIGRAWSRAEWVEATMPRWADLVEPWPTVSHAVGAAMGNWVVWVRAVCPRVCCPGVNPAAMMGQMDGMLRRLHGNIFSAQAGQAIGHLATEVLTGCEPSLPLVASPSVVLVPHNVEAFARDNELEGGELTVHLAAREAARVRLFHAVPGSVRICSPWSATTHAASSSTPTPSRPSWPPSTPPILRR